MPEYGEHAYWTTRFRTSPAPFDWLLPFAQFRDHLLPVLGLPETTQTGGKEAKAPRVLHLGCGTSTLPLDLAALGYVTDILHTDYVESVIVANTERHPHLRWQTVDALHLSEAFPPASFDLVLEKSVTDAISCLQPTIDGTENVDMDGRENAVMSVLEREIHRVLRPGGRWWMLSYTADRRDFSKTAAPGRWHCERIAVPVVDEAADGTASAQAAALVVFRPVVHHYIYIHTRL